MLIRKSQLSKWVLAVALAPCVVLADDKPVENVWIGKGQLGYVASQGNTDAQSGNAALDMALLSGQWKHALHLGGVYGENSGVTSAERWDAMWQSDYAVSGDLFTFGALRYAHDMYSGYRIQGSVAAGMGYRFIHSETTTLVGQVGVGYRRSRPERIVKDATGVVTSRVFLPYTNDAIVTAGLDYSQKFTATTTVSNKLRVESGSSNTLITDTLALDVKMSNRLALSVGVTVQNNTKPPPGLKKVDTLETLNLVYSF